MRTSRLKLAAVFILTVFLAAACIDIDVNPPPTPTPSVTTTTQPTKTPSPTRTTTRPPTTSPSPTRTTTPAPTPSFRSPPIVVDRTPTVPPIPVLIGVRAAQHPEEGFDRITFDFTVNSKGELPGYRIRYVDVPRDCGTGDQVQVTGRRFLEITFEPTHAHTEQGQPTIPRSQQLGFPQMESWTRTCDFEAVTTIVLGLDDVVGIRVGELSNPARIYVDVAA